MNGKIIIEESTKTLMEKYEVSNIEDLFIEIMLTEDDQRDSVCININNNDYYYFVH